MRTSPVPEAAAPAVGARRELRLSLGANRVQLSLLVFARSMASELMLAGQEAECLGLVNGQG